MSDMNNPADDNNGAMDDLWAEALSEQKSTSSKSAATPRHFLVLYSIFSPFRAAAADRCRHCTRRTTNIFIW